VILIVDTYHHVDDRIGYFRNLRRALRRRAGWPSSTGRSDHPRRPRNEHKLARGTVVDDAGSGLPAVDEPSLLPYQYFLVFVAR
jgi:hypothetical protein